MSVKVENLTKSFGEVVALNKLSFRVPSGSFTAVLGPSGCGKTTLLRCIAGVETPDAGKIVLGDKLVFSSEDSVNIQPERRHVGMVYQSFALWPHMNVYDNVAFPLKIRRLNRNDIDSMVKRVLERLRIGELADRYPTQLSGGQQQRVALARALVYEPPILLLDEPLSGLDESTRRSIATDLKTLQKSLKLDTIYVTHNREEALWLGDNIAVIKKGKLVAEGKAASLINNPPNAYTANFLGGMTLLDGTVKARGQDYYIVQTEIGELMARGEKGLSYRSEVQVGINEKHILLQDSESVENRIEAVVESTNGIQADGSYEYTVIVSGRKLTALAKSGELPKGTPVRISISAADCLIIPNQ